MKKVLLHLKPRALRDIDDLVRFVARFPRGKPEQARGRILGACVRLQDFPRANRVGVRRRRSRLELRRYGAHQFAIVYAYFPPISSRPWGIVSVRAVRHWRTENVFFGVREKDDGSVVPTMLRCR